MYLQVLVGLLEVLALSAVTHCPGTMEHLSARLPGAPPTPAARQVSSPRQELTWMK